LISSGKPIRSASSRNVAERLVVAVVAGNGRHERLANAALRFDLAAHRRHRFGRRSDEDQPGILHGAANAARSERKPYPG
jgi:hypothetical protein